MGNHLKQCPSCGKDVAKSAKICPHCGKSLKMSKFLEFIILIIIISVVAIVFSPSKKERAKKRISTIEKLKNAKVSNLSPTGELALIFNMGSKYTDLQRDNKEKEIKGKIVEWNLKVYEIEKDGENYRITTSSQKEFGFTNIVGTSITLYPKNKEEIKYIENLKTQDPIRVKGRINGIIPIVRYIDLDPAILILNNEENPEKDNEQQEDYEAYKNTNENIKNNEKDNQYYTAQELNDIGYEFYKKKDYKNAYKYWKLATQEYPEFAMGHYNLACVMNIMINQDGCLSLEQDFNIKDVFKHLAISIKYKKDRWKRMQKDKDLKSIHSTFAYQKLLGANLKNNKNIQKFLTRVSWTGNNSHSTIKFIANINKDSGRFIFKDKANKNIKIKGTYVVDGNMIAMDFKGKTLIGSITANGELIFKDFYTTFKSKAVRDCEYD